MVRPGNAAAPRVACETAVQQRSSENAHATSTSHCEGLKFKVAEAQAMLPLAEEIWTDFERVRQTHDPQRHYRNTLNPEP